MALQASENYSIGETHMKQSISIVSLGLALILTGFPAAYSADKTEDDSGVIEEIIVTGERGKIRSLDRAMTVTGFN